MVVNLENLKFNAHVQQHSYISFNTSFKLSTEIYS